MTDTENDIRTETIREYVESAYTRVPRDEPMNLMGVRSGRITVCMPTPDVDVGSKGRVWVCRCTCGRFIRASYHDIMSGAVMSCGECDGTGATRSIEDLSGMQKGMLKVIRPADPSRLDVYLCRCDCGAIVSRDSDYLLDRSPKSCGCLERSFEPDGPDISRCPHHPLRGVWTAMCGRRNRGEVEMDPLWDDFGAFYDWAYTHGWRPGMKIYRVDFTKPFGPRNCVTGDAKDVAMHRRPRGPTVKGRQHPF